MRGRAAAGRWRIARGPRAHGSGAEQMSRDHHALDPAALPEGLRFADGALVGTPLQTGEFEVPIVAAAGPERVGMDLSFTVFGPNLAGEASEIVAHVDFGDGEERFDFVFAEESVPPQLPVLEIPRASSEMLAAIVERNSMSSAVQ